MDHCSGSFWCIWVGTTVEVVFWKYWFFVVTSLSGRTLPEVHKVHI